MSRGMYLVEQSLLSLVVQGEGNVAGGALQGEGERFSQMRRKELEWGRKE